MTEFKNVEIFEKFLKENLRKDLASNLIFDLKEWLDDLENQHAANGTNEYELNSFYTKSKRPECIRFEYHVDEDPDCPDCFDEIYEF